MALTRLRGALHRSLQHFRDLLARTVLVTLSVIILAFLSSVALCAAGLQG